MTSASLLLTLNMGELSNFDVEIHFFFSFIFDFVFHILNKSENATHHFILFLHKLLPQISF